ncbi:hypothetical protein OG401_03385 [Kitasatospora purpeofusca]|uniref:hypothetical protein n=1 Tax=Kitasatospora purpeofusca TaxID=67352 RepID=UPI0022593C1D|nr:hypothetical protein [Kitasatospora purpeofusca]MCX4683355.1 hypothetical protein [Kitasatospora purpeofusca]
MLTSRLVEYEGAPHGFFNPGAGPPRWFEETTALATAFVLEHTRPHATEPPHQGGNR